jgi:hypothetical protein
MSITDVDTPAPEELIQRAMAAFVKYGGRHFRASTDSDVEEIGGKLHAILRNARGIIAVYRYKPDGRLRRLRRWPKEI